MDGGNATFRNNVVHKKWHLLSEMCEYCSWYLHICAIVNIKQNLLYLKWGGNEREQLQSTWKALVASLNTESSSRHINMRFFSPPKTQFKQAQCVGLPVGSSHFIVFIYYSGNIRAVKAVLLLSSIMTDISVLEHFSQGGVMSQNVFCCDKGQGDTEVFPLVIFYCCSVW